MEKLKCLGIGAGAIGKSITGYIFSHIPCDFLYAEIDDRVIRDIRQRGGYNLFSSSDGVHVTRHEIRGLLIDRAESERVKTHATEADIICTAVGALNLPAVAKSLADWIQARKSDKRLAVLLFENGSHLAELMKSELLKYLPALPGYLSISHASIERISKKTENEAGEIDGVSEEFIPPALTRAGLTDTALPDYPDYFQLVEDADAYYYRKLYLNNIGHAVLGYMGLQKGYETTVETVRDPEIRSVLLGIWESAGKMIAHQYGFTEEELKEYFAGRLQCYENAALADPLKRLARSPLRKLARSERIVGCLEQCFLEGANLQSFFPLFHAAVHYAVPEDADTPKLAEFRSRGIENLILNVCGVRPDEPLYQILTEGYNDYDQAHQ